MNLLISSVIHDVKNQLGELALRLEQRGDAQAELALTVQAAQRLTKLLLWQREQAGQLTARIDAYSPADLLQELTAEYRALFPRLDWQIELASAPDHAYFDRELVRLALGNAIHNACRHATRFVRLNAVQENQQLVITIENDGKFPPSILEHGGHLPQAVSEHGTGMGLYLARQIAHLHTLKGLTGEIELANAPHATFRMRLP